MKFRVQKLLELYISAGGGPERSRKNEYSGGRLRYLDAAIEAAKRFWVGPPRQKFYASLGCS